MASDNPITRHDEMMKLLITDSAWADMLIVSKWDWPRRVFVVCPVCCSIVLDEARLTHIAWHDQIGYQ